jgi:hypothetical protein
VVPPLCPLSGSPCDFSHTGDHIERAVQATDAWLMQGGLGRTGIPGELPPHAQPSHRWPGPFAGTTDLGERAAPHCTAKGSVSSDALIWSCRIRYACEVLSYR